MKVYTLKNIKTELTRAVYDNAVTPKDCELLIKDLCIHWPISVVSLPYTKLVRCSYNKTGEMKSEVFSTVSRLSYNPFIESIPLQRCNYEHQQIFYAAAGLDNAEVSMLSTSILEVCLEHIKNEDMNTHYMTLSRWVINNPLHVVVLPYSPESIRTNPEFKFLSEHFESYIEKVAESFELSKEEVRI